MLRFISQSEFLFRIQADREYEAYEAEVERLNAALEFPEMADEIRTDEYDLFLPKKRTGQERILVNIHGGLPVLGNKDLNRHWNARLAEQGVLVISLEYPKITESTFSEQLQAVKDHLEHAWVQVQAMTTQKQIYLTGDTYGALLCFYTAAVQKERHIAKKFGVEPVTPPIHAMGLFSGLFDTTSSDKLGTRLSRHLWGKDAAKKYGNLVDPGYIVGFRTMPPIFLATSKGDPVRNYSEVFRDACREAELTLEYHEYMQEDPIPAFQVFMPELEETQQTIRDLLNFFESA